MSTLDEVLYKTYMSDYDSLDFRNKTDTIFTDVTNDSESGDDPDGYDDHNGFYRISISAIESKTIVDRYRKDFKGREWYPQKFFKKMYLRSLLTDTKNFLAELEEMDLTDVTRKKSIKNKIVKFRQALRRAEKFYDKHEFRFIAHIHEGIEYGKSVVEDLFYLDRRGKLK